MVIDTHSHLDVEEFHNDLPDVIARAKAAGVGKIFIPAVDLPSIEPMMAICQNYPDYAFPMIGLQPEEVKADWQEVLNRMWTFIEADRSSAHPQVIAIGECGLDFYWSREFEQEQLAAFEQQVQWSVSTRLPLMIHCRKAQNELLAILRKYEADLPGGVFHCFTGNQQEAREFLRMPRFMLGIGGVSTFKSSHLREDLPAAVPLDRIVLETDSPYMAPVPHRGQRNESSFIIEVQKTLAAAYGVSEEEIAQATNENVKSVFGSFIKEF